MSLLFFKVALNTIEISKIFVGEIIIFAIYGGASVIGGSLQMTPPPVIGTGKF